MLPLKNGVQIRAHRATANNGSTCSCRSSTADVDDHAATARPWLANNAAVGASPSAAAPAQRTRHLPPAQSYATNTQIGSRTPRIGEMQAGPEFASKPTATATVTVKTTENPEASALLNQLFHQPQV